MTDLEGTPLDHRSTFTTPSRGGTFVALVGLMVGCLVIGLAVPFVFGERVDLAAGFGGSDTVAAGPGASSAAPVDASSPSATATSLAANRTTAVTATPVGGPGGAAAGPVGGPAPAAGGPPPAPGSLTASDVGVTAETITVGAIVQDVAGAGRVGFGAAAGLDPEQQRRAWDSYFAELNAHGGINGRQVVPKYRTVDLFDPDSARAACTALTQDEHVFAVLSPHGFWAGTRCVAIENATPLVLGDSLGTPTEWINQAGGRLVTTFPGSGRMMSMFVGRLQQLGLLAGHRIGILTDQVDQSAMMLESALLPALAQHGLEPTYVARLSADGGTAASQIPVEVQNMRSRQVDVVLLVTGALNQVQFVLAADQQGYRPEYYATDWGSTSDAGSENMPPGFDGSLWISSTTASDWNADLPERAAGAHCREVYEAATGDRLNHDTTANRLKADFTILFCDLANIFGAAARAAGPNLTREAFSSGLQGLGAFDLATFGPGSFTSGKVEYSDQVRTHVWRADCRCWMPAGDFGPA